jgi:ATP-dependent DNA helicase RecQ
MTRSSTRKPPVSSKQPADISWPEILRTAQQRFHIKRFRPGQREVLESVFRSRDTLALMPTGAGKSLTYQLPALFLPKPVVVVSPLIALMQDQQQKAAEADVVVEKLDSTLRKSEAEQAVQQIAQREAQLIYVTPERLQSPDFVAELKTAGGISLLVVDEAHTIAQWGHDFRPAFRAIGEARKALGNPPILALTATATEEVAKEILETLHAEDAHIISTGTERENLFFAVHPTVNNQAKLARIEHMLQREEGTGIIYTASVRSANELFDYLTERGVSVGHYHGRMPARERERVQQEFMRGVHKVMIATKAFGLGIDKPDIRFVFHFEFPDSLETYYQEAGRAGRDGKPARAVLLYRLEDRRIQTFFLAGRYPKPEELTAVAAALTRPSPGEPPNLDLSSFGAAGGSASLPQSSLSAETIAHLSNLNQRRTQSILNLLTEANLTRRTRTGYTLARGAQPTTEALTQLLQTCIDRAIRDKDRLAEMMHYAETPNCRTQIIRTYFGEPEGNPCNRCDNCLRNRVPHDHEAEGGVIVGSLSSLTSPSPREPVTTVPTPYGEIQTTAPETLPAPSPEPRFQPGTRVLHKRFGQGTVLDLHNDIVLVDFLKSGQKRLRADFLQAA